MIDEAAIAILPDRIRIRPNLIDDNAPKLGVGFLAIRYNRSNDAKKTEQAMYPVYSSSFDLFADGALRVYTRSKECRETIRSEQFVYRIELNLRKILWGHNGINIRDGEDLCHALLIVRHALQHLLVDPKQASMLIPGLYGNKISYWHSMELALDVLDPGFVIRRRMEWMRSPCIRRNPDFYQNTALLDGKFVKIKAYDKIAQMKDRHKVKKRMIVAGEDPVTRLEVKLKRNKMTDYEKLDTAFIPALSRISNNSRLTGFTWEQLKAIHRHYFSNLKAVYHSSAEKGAPRDKGYAAVLAAIAIENEIHPLSIYELLKAHGGKSTNTCNTIRSEMELHISQASVLTAEHLLSDEAYRNQPVVDVASLGGCRFYVKQFGWQEISEEMCEVQKIYGDAAKRGGILNPQQKPYLFW